MNIVFTVCNRTQLPNALALGVSVLRHHPDYLFYIGWADKSPISNLPKNIKAISVEKLGIQEWGEMCARYYDFELVAASRPWFAKGILKANPDCSSLTFLSPTTILYDAMQEINDPAADLFLTPNITKPLAASKNLDDKRILNIGMFHSGGWALKPNPVTLKMLEWWAHRTIDRAKFDLCNGMCMDQLWLNYAPVWVEKTTKITHPGWHYGLQSILNKTLTEKNGSFSVENEKLISADFAGMTHFDPVWSNHQMLAHQSPAFKKLFKEYSETVKTFDKGLPDREPGYGKIPEISDQRLLRKNLTGKLKAITTFIDQF
ncbi:hypothetical protein [Dyadobacter sp. CY356]|uniref:hypothetical protein n=1 Tax=Dyadobacter sp. CY356 TaxID=2906442 RepID=UPI001F2A598D|nr:hypothetical protein [Dyadobacter sp. CY356]MCF0059671.1 hypothetical protein [Dyadobacter sp. CY356]